MSVLVANGWFIKPKPFPYLSGGPSTEQRVKRAMLRIPFFVAAWAVAGAAADRCCGKDGYNSPHGDVALSENGDDLCCREYAAPGRTPLIEQLKCDVLPTETCFANEATGFMDSKDLGLDPGECCAACLATAGCKSWVHVPGTGSGPGKPQSGQTYECSTRWLSLWLCADITAASAES